ncbi:MAG TPA: Hsp20/alpha crystallin family protein [Aggregatilineales bacterium]|nr:Hsp20/alpha crystallin family protein [Aggregatilineales bacterium]
MANETPEPLKNLGDAIRTTVNRTLEDLLSLIPGTQALPVDIYETPTAIMVKAGPLVGVEPENIDVSLTADTLTIKGEIKPDDDLATANVLRRERKVGTFARAVTIPRNVKADQATASFKNNTLTITLPKVEEPQPKIINVKTVDQG